MAVKKRLSIVIPFYNVEKYIAKCLQSVYEQDIPEEEYEVICVNDCSPDNSREIVLEFQKKHKNLVLIQHEVNKMLGAARNSGFLAAQGKYVWFIDSDDWIAAKCLGKLLDTVEKNNLDILEFNCYDYEDGNLSNRYYYLPNDTDIITGFDYLNFKQISIQAWSKIIRKKFLLDNQIFSPVKMYFQDHAFSLRCLLAAQRCKFIADRIYFYRIREGATSTLCKEKGQRKANVVRFCCECIELLDKHKDKDFYAKRINRYTCEFLHLLPTIARLPFKEKILYIKTVQETDRHILRQYLPSWLYFCFLCPSLVFFYGWFWFVFRVVGKIRKWL
jgi:glycosyltransferase involved in cell wall biosynthesis